MVRKKRIKNKTSVLLFIALMLVVASLYFAFFLERPIQIEEFDVVFQVAETHPGFDVNSSLLIFGRTSPGGPTLVRTLNVSNSYNHPIRIDVLLTENINEAIMVDSSYWFGIGEQKGIPFELKIPEDFPLGDYEGKVRLEMYKID